MRRRKTTKAELYLAKWGVYMRHHGYDDIGYYHQQPFIDGPGVIRSTADGQSLPDEVDVICGIIAKADFTEEHRFCLKCRYIKKYSARKVEEIFGIGRTLFTNRVAQAEKIVSTLLGDA